MSIPTRTIDRLKSRLASHVERPSAEFRSPVEGFPSENPFAVDATVLYELEAIFEAMYLAMAADGDVADVERELLAATMTALSGGRIRAIQIEQMIDEFGERLREGGLDERLAFVGDSLRASPLAAEAAWALAAAIVDADGRVLASELALLGRLAEALALDAARVEALRAEVSADAR